MPQELNCDHTVIELIMNNGVYSILNFLLMSCLPSVIVAGSLVTLNSHIVSAKKVAYGETATCNNQVELL